ncbi:MAG: hypothetical protein M1829_006533 [Trizodia sp. TS-e1964]|nr:MAG: hypothetical protein M1829_006533 [Trizodia sp. TS-e1964]
MSLHKYLLGLGHKMIPRTRDYLDKTFIKDMTTDPGQLVNQTSPIRHTEIPLPNQKKPRGAAHPDGINIDGEDNLRPRISPNHRKHGTEPNELRVSRKVSPNRREKIKSKMISHSSHLDKCAESDSPRKRIHSSMEAPTSNHATRSRVQSVVGHSDSPVEIYGLSSNQRDVVKNSKAPEKPAQSLNRLMVSVEIETPSKATANNLEFSYGTRPKASPSLLPSQSRSTRASSKVFAHQDHHTHEFPEEERYSKRIGLGTPWHCALVYPSEGPRKATVDFGDLDRLDEGQFLNDNIIAFHLRYLEEQFHKSNPETAKKVYMFNTFFYERLTSSSRRGIDYEAVKKWTSKIDIFDYDFLVVPINESAHWYVAIICNLPNLPTDAENFPPPATSELQKDRETIFEPDSYHILTDEDPKPETKSITPSSKSAEKGLSELNLEDSEAEEIDNSRSFQGTDAARAYAHTDPDKDIDSEEWPPEHEESLGAANPVKIFHPTVNPEDNSESHLIAEDIYAFPDETLKPIVDASPQSKNGKRKSLPPLKKYDVDKPVIISMDSLGVTHSATARNLKEYLVCESKRKPSLSLSVSDISGMTARGIPEQDNFCDCGIFLLAYMEKFLNDPQGLVKKILQRELDQAFDWPTMNASKMRHDLRDLIQNLWNQQNELIAKERRQKALQNGHYHGKTGAKPIENIKAPSLEHSSAWPNFSSQNDEPRDLIETPEDSCPGSSRINGEGGSVPKQNHTFETTTVPPVTPDRCTTAQHNPEELDISDLLFSQKRHTDPKLPNSMKAVSPQHEAQEISKSPILSYRSPQRISLRKIRRSFTPPQIQQERRQISPHKVSKPGTKSAAKPLGMAAKDRDLSPSKIRHHGHSGSDLSDDELQKDFNCLKPHLKAPMEITGHPSGRPVVFDEG